MNRRSFLRSGLVTTLALPSLARALTQRQRLMLQGPAEFDPSDIGSLTYDFDSRYGMYSDAGTTQCVNGGTIYRWVPVVGAASAINTTQGNRPYYLDNSLNGFPALEVKGAAKWLTLASANIAQPNSVVLVAKQTSKAQAARFVDGTGRQLMGLNTSGRLQMSAGNLVYGTSTDYSGMFAVFSFVFNGASSQCFVNSTLNSTVDAGTQGVTNMFIGSDAATNTYHNIVRLVTFGKAITQSDVAFIADGMRALYEF